MRGRNKISFLPPGLIPDGVIGSKIHWEPYYDFEALLSSLSFLAPGDRTGMLCRAFSKLEVSSTITFGVVVGWGKTYESGGNAVSHSCNSFLTRYGCTQNG